MLELRITLSEHDEALEEEVKRILQPYSDEFYIVEEHGDAGLVINLIVLLMGIPNCILSIIEIKKLIDEKIKKSRNCYASIEAKDVNSGVEHETPFKAEISLNGQIVNMDGLSEEEQKAALETVIAEEESK